MKSKQFFFTNPKDFYVVNGRTDTFLRANICATDTPDIVISRDERREISLRVSLVH